MPQILRRPPPLLLKTRLRFPFAEPQTQSQPAPRALPKKACTSPGTTPRLVKELLPLHPLLLSPQAPVPVEEEATVKQAYLFFFFAPQKPGSLAVPLAKLAVFFRQSVLFGHPRTLLHILPHAELPDPMEARSSHPNWPPPSSNR